MFFLSFFLNNLFLSIIFLCLSGLPICSSAFDSAAPTVPTRRFHSSRTQWAPTCIGHPSSVSWWRTRCPCMLLCLFASAYTGSRCSSIRYGLFSCDVRKCQFSRLGSPIRSFTQPPSFFFQSSLCLFHKWNIGFAYLPRLSYGGHEVEQMCRSWYR